MAKFCTECGKEIQAGVAFCTECGAKAPTDAPQNVTENAASEPKTEQPVPQTPPTQPPQAQQQPQQPRTAPPQQNYQAPIYQQPTYQQPVYQQSAAIQTPTPDPKSKVVSTGAYFGLMLLFALPVIGFIVCIIMCFAPKNENLKHYARATMIWVLVGVILMAILAGLFLILGNTILDFINDSMGSEFSNWGDLFSNY